MTERKGYRPIKRNILLNPGPATTTDTIKYAQVVPDICPREKEFSELIENVREQLTRFVGNPDKYTTVLLGGSGTRVSKLAEACPIGRRGRVFHEGGLISSMSLYGTMSLDCLVR